MEGTQQHVDKAVIVRSGLLLNLHQAGCPAILPAFVDLPIFQAWCNGPSAWRWSEASSAADQRKKSKKVRNKRQKEKQRVDPQLEELSAIFKVCMMWPRVACVD